MNDAEEIMSRLGKENMTLLAQAVYSLRLLRELFLQYREYTQPLSDVITDAMNRRVLLDKRFREGGYFASVRYDTNSDQHTCEMEFQCEAEGVFSFGITVYEDEDNDVFEIILEEGASTDFIRRMLETLLICHMNLYEQLTAVSKGYGQFIVEPKKPN